MTDTRFQTVCRFRSTLVLAVVLALPSEGWAQSAPPVLDSSAPSLAAPQAGDSSPPSLPVQERVAEAAPATAAVGGRAEDPQAGLQGASQRAADFLRDGGPTIWAIAGLSVITVALILWKLWRFFLAGAWSRRAARRAVDIWEAGQHRQALALVSARRGLRSRLTASAMRARLSLPDTAAREETSRVARKMLARQGAGLRALELIATIAPLLGLLGTVLGMISAFQALQGAGSRADPAMLAGGIWEALLTTAAGMAVAIPASAALTWFEAVIARVRHDMESMAARLFVAESGAGESESS